MGQTFALLLVKFALGLTLNLVSTLGIVAVSAALNLWLSTRYSPKTLLSARDAWIQLAFDLTHLSALLLLTGGLVNPFSVLMVAPITVAASNLSRRLTYGLTGYALVLLGLVGIYSMPLPWDGPAPPLSPLLVIGIGIALGFTMVFLSLYLGRVGHEARAREYALAATQIALEREQRLAALGALAAAAAHELGTPLGTIMLVSKEALRQNDLPPHARDDLELIYTEVKRCQETLQTLSRGDEDQDPYGKLTPSALLREAAAPHENRRISIHFTESLVGDLAIKRRAETIHGLRNIIENAVDYARSEVRLEATSDPDSLCLIIEDDGPGFDTAVIRKLGEPYIYQRPKKTEKTGLGLGLFIACTLLERTGAEVSFSGGTMGGALVTIRWPLGQIQDTGTEAKASPSSEQAAH